MAHRIVGVVRHATAEVTHSAFVLDLEKRRQRQTNIVERTTSAMSRAVTVADVTAALTGPGGLARLGADGLALGLVENSALNIVALSGESLEVLDGLGSGGLDRNLPLADTIRSGRPRFITSLAALARRYPELEPHLGKLRFRAAAYLPLVAQARLSKALIHESQKQYSEAIALYDEVSKDTTSMAAQEASARKAALLQAHPELTPAVTNAPAVKPAVKPVP